MSKAITEGDRVRVCDREPTTADVKSQLFYAHYRNLTGTVTKTYADGTLSLKIDSDSLPNEITKRHNESADVVRKKFLGELSEEGRNKLSAADKKFDISYNILIAGSDVIPMERTKQAVANTPKAAPAAATAAAEDLFEAASQPVARPTLEDLERAEQQHLEELRQKSS